MIENRPLMRTIIFFFFINCLFFIETIAIYGSYAYNPYIFKITAKKNSGRPQEQTGFRIQGKSGIITALHGVIGQESISASIVGLKKRFSDLEIEQVDIEHDLALLTSNELKKNNRGLKVSRLQPSKQDKVSTIGYPLGISEQLTSTQLNLRTPPLKKLITLLLKRDYKIMMARKSPDIKEEVLSIEGELLPGHSGAPIFNANDEVIGIGNGGLKKGSVGISWAIPYSKINWASSIAKKEELEHLERSQKLNVFSNIQDSDGELLEWQEPRAGKMMTWNEANEYVEKMNRESLQGFSDWRLPAIGELQDLAQVIKSVPGSYSGADKLYWSSEDIGAVEANVVNLGNAKMKWSDTDEQVAIRSKRRKFSVRLVRSLIQ